MEEYSGNQLLSDGTWARTVIGDRLLSPPPLPIHSQESLVGKAANHGESEILPVASSISLCDELHCGALGS